MYIAMNPRYVSPIVFCIYIDDLFTRLSSSGVGCYVGLDFAGALSCADDMVILAPTPTAMHKLLAICDSYATKFDIVFNTIQYNTNKNLQDATYNINRPAAPYIAHG